MYAFALSLGGLLFDGLLCWRFNGLSQARACWFLWAVHVSKQSNSSPWCRAKAYHPLMCTHTDGSLQVLVQVQLLYSQTSPTQLWTCCGSITWCLKKHQILSFVIPSRNTKHLKKKKKKQSSHFCNHNARLDAFHQVADRSAEICKSHQDFETYSTYFKMLQTNTSRQCIKLHQIWHYVQAYSSWTWFIYRPASRLCVAQAT